MARLLLIGYGNTLRGDDALGPMAIERLRMLLPDAKFVSCHQLNPELAEPLADCDLAVFVDAACDTEPGTVHVKRLSPEGADVASLTHHGTPSSVLELAQTLYGRTPQAMLVTGAGAQFESSEGLSPKGHEALLEICRIIPLLVGSGIEGMGD